MANIEKIIDGLNIPKQLLEKSEALLKTLFGPAFEEMGGMIADNVKLRRFKNQVKILGKAEYHLKKNNLQAKKISLKVLAPMIEYSSLEEEDTLQEKWAYLIANSVREDKDVVFKQNAISILNKLSVEEASLLDTLHIILNNKRKAKFEQRLQNYKHIVSKNPATTLSPPKNANEIAIEYLIFNVYKIAKDLKIDKRDLEFSLTNLISLGLLKWETDVEVKAEKSSDDPEDNEIEVDVTVYNNDEFVFTSIGDKFVKICKEITS